MKLRMRRDVDVEVLAGLGPDECDQITGVREVPRLCLRPGRKVTPDHHEVADPQGSIGGEQPADAVPAGRDAGEMWGDVGTGADSGVEVFDRLIRPIWSGSVGPARDREVGRVKGAKPIAEETKACGTIGRSRGEELEAEERTDTISSSHCADIQSKAGARLTGP